MTKYSSFAPSSKKLTQASVFEAGGTLVILFAGSKGGSGRTTTSLALALGFAKVDLPVAHIQILDGRCPPIFDGSHNSLFSVSAFLSNEVADIGKVCLAFGSADPNRVHVIDLPAGRPPPFRSLGPDVWVVVPYREGELDREAAANDVLDLSGGEDIPDAFGGFTLLPVASAASSADQLRVGFEGMGLPCGPDLPLPVIAPGMRRLSVSSMQSLTNGANFVPDRAALRAAKDLGGAVMDWIGLRISPFSY